MLDTYLANDLLMAYVGPGFGGGVIAMVLGVLGSLFLCTFAVVYYPIKRLLKGRNQSAEPESIDAVVEETP